MAYDGESKVAEAAWWAQVEDDRIALQKRTTREAEYQAAKSAGAPAKSAIASAGEDLLARLIKWPMLAPTFAVLYCQEKCFPRGLGLDLDRNWLFRTRVFRFIYRSAVYALFAALTIAAYVEICRYLVGPTISALNLHPGDIFFVCVSGAIVHLVLRFWRSNRNTVWVAAPAFGLWITCMFGVMDGLRGYVPRGEMTSFAIVGAGAMGLWLLLRPVYVMFGDIDGIEAAKEGASAESVGSFR